MNRGFLQNSAATIFVFDLSNRKTLEEVDIWQEEMEYNQRRKKVLLFYLVGHHLHPDRPRDISYDEAMQVAQGWNMRYMEVNARTGFNVRDLFDRISEELI